MRFKILTIIILCCVLSNAQNVKNYPKYPLPVKYPVTLSATFGELRDNSFHAGVDIKTDGTKQNVYAVADGYVSRIGISPWGYGKVVYVTHNDGFMSVYAHLDSFNDAISAYVKRHQYESHSFAQSLFLEKDAITIKSGDFLGLSGNTGSSGGPHLHYELRDANQHPIDPFLFGMEIEDNTRPTLLGLAVYPAEKSSVRGIDTMGFFSLVSQNGNYSPKCGDIPVNGKVFFGISYYDQTAGLNHKYGVDKIELYADNRLIFNIDFDEFSYDEKRYVNSLIDYARYMKDGRRYVRTEIDEYNVLSLYGERNGYIIVNEGDRIKMKFVVTDKSGNVSKIDFTLVGEEPLEEFHVTNYNRSYYRVDGKSKTQINLDGFTAQIPEKAFYKFEYIYAQQNYDNIGDYVSDCAYVFGSEAIPIQKPITVSIRPIERFAKSDKLHVISIDKNKNITSWGGKLVDGVVTTQIKNFGLFALAIDTIAPEVKPLNFSNNVSVSECKSLKFKIKDDGAGINSYNIYVNGKWVIGEYDAKNDLLFYTIDEHFRKGENKVEVVVTDGVNNETRQSYNLTW